jgi:hypothetical protein
MFGPLDGFDLTAYYASVSALCAFTVLWLMQCNTSAADITSRAAWIITVHRIALALFSAALFWTAATPMLEDVAPSLGRHRPDTAFCGFINVAVRKRAPLTQVAARQTV